MKRVGRPYIEDKRDIEIRVRFNKVELTSLEYLCQNHNMSKSELIRFFIFKQFSLHDFRSSQNKKIIEKNNA